MSLPVIVRPEAEEDPTNAHHWYEDRLPGLGVRLLERVELALTHLAEHPDAWPIAHRNVRRVVLRQFPYALFYLGIRQGDRLGLTSPGTGSQAMEAVEVAWSRTLSRRRFLLCPTA